MVEVRELRPGDLSEFIRLTDEIFGKGYFSKDKAERIIEASYFQGRSVSFVLVEKQTHTIVGVRLTYPPNQWIDRDPRQPIHPHLWDVPQEQTAYFQSVYLDPRYQGQGWGARLSDYSIRALRELGTRAIVCHSWDQSPHNSSRRYLDKLGFRALVTIPEYWKMIDYECTGCGKPCTCSATEMILYLDGENK